MKRLNVKFLLILIALGVLIAGGGAVAYKVQRRRSVEALLARAKAAERAGDVAKADELYAHYLGFRGDDPRAAADYGLMLAKAARSPESRAKALAALAQAIRRDPSRADTRREVVRIAMDRALQRYDLALEHLEALMAAAADDGMLEEQAARCLEASRKDSEAAAMYARAIAHAPGLVDAYVHLALLLRSKLGKPAEADQVNDQMVQRNPNSSRAYLERGKLRLQAGDKDGARDIDQALKLAPDDADALATAADLALEKGDVDRARAMASGCLKAKPDEPRFHDLAYRIEARAGRLEAAEAALRQGIVAVSESEGRLRLLINLAGLQIGRGDYAEAERSIGQLADQKARAEFIGYLKGRSLGAQGRWRDAAKALDDAHGGLEGVPTMAYDADLLLARCRERLGEADLRQAALRRAIALDPAGPPARLALAEALADSGRIDESIEQYRSLEAEVPGVRLPLARLLIRGNLAKEPASRDWAEVDRVLAQVEPTATATGSPEFPILRAEVFAARGRPDDARAELEAAAKAFPKSDAPPIALAFLAAKEGRPEAALERLDQAGRELGDRVALRLARAELGVARGGEGAVEALNRLAQGTEKLSEADRAGLLRGLAEAHRRLGDRAGARAILDGLAQRSPDDLGLSLARFDLAIQMDDQPAMKAIVAKIADEDEALAFLARARYLAWSAAHDPRAGGVLRAPLDEARQLLNRAATRRPNWSPAVRATAYVDDLAGDQDRAIKGYLRAIELGDRDAEIATRAVQLLLGLGRPDEADRVVLRAIGDDPGPKPQGFYRVAAEVALRVKQMARAVDYATKAVPAQAAPPVDRLWRGRLLWAAGSAPRAEPDLVAAAAGASEAEAEDAWTTLVAYLAATHRQARAEEAVEQARKTLPERVKPLALARCFAILERPDQAQEQYRAAVAAWPEDVPTLETAANLALRLGKLDDAKGYLRKLLAHRLDAPGPASRARRILGVLLAASGDRRQARESLEVMGMVGDDPSSRRTWADQSSSDLRAKANVLALRGGRGHRRAALEALAIVVGRGEANPDDRLLMARLFEVEGDWPKARDQVQLALAEADDSPGLLAFYVRGLLKHDEASGAGPWLQKLEKLDPSARQTAELKARLAVAEGRAGDAARIVVDFARGRPAEALPAALLLESLGRLAEAEDLFRQFASKGQTAEAGLPLAAFFGRRARVDEALDLCDLAWASAVRVEAVSQASVTVLHDCMAGEDACRRVVGRLEAATAKAPSNAQLRFDLANVRVLLGDLRGAEKVYRALYEKDPENYASANNLAWLLSLQEGKADEAIALIDKTIDLAGPLPTLLDTRGMARSAAGQVAAAIEDLEDATESGPSPTRFFHLARVYLMAKRPKDARAALQEATTLGLDQAKLHPIDRKALDRLVGELARE